MFASAKELSNITGHGGPIVALAHAKKLSFQAKVSTVASLVVFFHDVLTHLTSRDDKARLCVFVTFGRMMKIKKFVGRRHKGC